jgi:excisionase family DNA binding protein
MESFETLMDSDAAAALLKIHRKTLERMALRGEVPGHKVGKFWRFRARNFARRIHHEVTQQDSRKFANVRFALAFWGIGVIVLAVIWQKGRTFPSSPPWPCGTAARVSRNFCLPCGRSFAVP